MKTPIRVELIQPISTESAHDQLARLRQNKEETIEAFGDRDKKHLTILNNFYSCSTNIAAETMAVLREQTAKLTKTVFEGGIFNVKYSTLKEVFFFNYHLWSERELVLN